MNRLADVANQFYAQVNPDFVYAMTIGEEQVFWGNGAEFGQSDLLSSMYDKLKVRTTVPIYQWYTPAGEGTAPGLTGFPNIKADGWVSDEYVLDQPYMERNMRQYTVMQKPIINTIWAGEHPTIPFLDSRFQGAVAVHQKYNIPMNFWDFSSIQTGVSGHTPGNNTVLAAEFQKVRNAAIAAKSAPPVDMNTWDTVPWQIPTIPIQPISTGSTSNRYAEYYATDRVIRFVNDTAITGFADLRWDSTAVELRPRQAGTAQSSVTYNFENPGTLAYVSVVAPAFTVAGKNATVSMSVLDSDGRLIGSTSLNGQASMSLGISGAEFTGRQFKVVYTMNGTAAAAKEVLAGVNSIEVNTITGSTPLNDVMYSFDFSSPAEQSRWTATLNPATGPKGPQYNATTVHYDAQSNTYQPLNTSEVRVTPASPTQNGKGEFTLVRRFDASPGKTLNDLVFEANAFGYSSWGTQVQLWLSKDGTHWDAASAPASAGYVDQHLTADSTNLAGYDGLSSAWLKIRMYDIYGFGDPAQSYVHAWNFTLRARETVSLSSWSVAAGGSWSSPANWTGEIPGAIGDYVAFGPTIASPQAVLLDSPKTIGTIKFDSDKSYTLKGSSSLTLDVATGQADIKVMAGSHVLAVPVVLNKDTTFTTVAGSGVSLTNSLAAAGTTVTKTGAGTVQFQNLRAAGLSVNEGTVKISSKLTANSAAGASVLNGLAIADGASLDLSNNSLIVDYTTAGTLVSDIRGLLAEGKLTTSALDPAKKLAYADNAVTGLATFSGQVIDSTSILVKYTWSGDANLDGQVDISDLGSLATAWQSASVWTGGDFDYSGFIDISDLGILATNWQAGVGLSLTVPFEDALASVGLEGVMVPEPAALASIAIALGLLRGRRGMLS